MTELLDILHDMEKHHETITFVPNSIGITITIDHLLGKGGCAVSQCVSYKALTTAKSDILGQTIRKMLEEVRGE